MQIGLFGGSFNPLHVGHLHVAREALRQAQLDAVWLMVSPHNPLKDERGMLSAALRYHLARIALHDNRHIKASDFEFRLPRPSYTWNTLHALKQEYSRHRFHLIVGEDNWQLFSKWFRYEDILQSTPIIVYPRHVDDGQQSVSKPTVQADVKMLTGQFVNVSSTDLRRCLGKGLPTEQLLPKMIQPLLLRFYKG